MRERFGPYPAEDHSKIGMVPLPDPEGFRRRLLAAVARKSRGRDLADGREDWDLFLVVFGECHGAGHYFWHYQDPSTWRIRRTRAPSCAPLSATSMPRSIARSASCSATSDQETTVLLVAGDGMGPNYSGSHVLGHLLARMGLLHDAQLGPADAGAAPARAGTRARAIC